MVILEINKSRLWKFKTIVQGHKLTRWQSQDLDQGQCDSKPTLSMIARGWERTTCSRSLSKQKFHRGWSYLVISYQVLTEKTWETLLILYSKTYARDVCKPLWNKLKTVQFTGKILVNPLFLLSLQRMSCLLDWFED